MFKIWGKSETQFNFFVYVKVKNNCVLQYNKDIWGV